MSSVVNGFVYGIHKRLKKCLAQKWYVFGSPGWIPKIHHSVVLELLYNMRLEQKISIEAFQSYTLEKLVQKLHFNSYCVHIQHTISR